MDIPEPDWKTLRALQAALLDRFCGRVLDECRALCDDAATPTHQRYLALYDLMRKRDKELAQAFDDVRRSTAMACLITMHRDNLLTEDELARFSDETRRLVTRSDW